MTDKQSFPTSQGELDVDYGSLMVVDREAREREISQIRNSLQKSESTPQKIASSDLQHGVSVVIPSYMGNERVATCLQSLVDQTLDPRSFEIILVINGPDDGSYAIASSMSDIYPEHHIRILYQARPSAGAARNIGIKAAQYAYLTFVDDDDFVGPSFLADLLGVAGPNRVSISPIINVDPSGEEDPLNALNVQISAKKQKKFKFKAVSSLLGFNACKLVPTTAVKKLEYSESLRSGEDVCFMAHLAVDNEFDAKVATVEASGAYFRVLRDASISRQPRDFDFAVQQRLEVMHELESRRSWDSSANDALLTGLIRSQANFIKGYLEANPEERPRIIEAIEGMNLKDFPWSRINEGTARDLVISYCFAPFSDTSAVVAAKAIVERGKVVDVIYNNMGSVRRKDSNLETIAGRLLDHVTEINSPPSFSGWKEISDFVKKGISVADRRDALVGGYETLYSRVLWPGSHFLAALFKIRHSAVKWTAEFSDPLSTDAHGEPRAGNLVRDESFDVFNRAVSAKGFSPLDTDSLFTWCEYITYILADELIFTNENQLEYMLKGVSDKRLKRLITEKATVRVHPTPPKRSYEVLSSAYPLSDSVVNVGYFGAFYGNRGLREVLTALANSSNDVRRKLRLHVFTNKPDEMNQEVQQFGLTGIVKPQNYRPYLEFLNLTTKFDVLLVNDVERTGEMSINPFLPSKYSDYLGSDRPIWGLVDDGSPLSTKELSYRSAVGDSVGAVHVLENILSDWLDRDRGSE